METFGKEKLEAFAYAYSVISKTYDNVMKIKDIDFIGGWFYYDVEEAKKVLTYLPLYKTTLPEGIEIVPQNLTNYETHNKITSLGELEKICKNIVESSNTHGELKRF